MYKAYSIIFLFYFFTTSAVASAQPESISFSYGTHNSEPFAFTHKGIITGGIIWDIAHALADELSVQARFVNVPRKRQEKYLADGLVDIILISNPHWSNNKDNIVWSNPLFSEQDKLVIHHDNPISINVIADLAGLHIGTIRGFKYDLIDNLSVKKIITKHDVKEVSSNVEKLLRNRIDGFVESSTLVNYLLSKREDKNKFRIVDLTLSEHNVYASISPIASFDSHKVIMGLDKLKNNGVIATILKKYK